MLGGGYIGLEFGQMFRRFGSEVTIVEGAPRLMMMEDEDVADEVAAILRDDGITVLTSTTPLRVERADGGRLRADRPDRGRRAADRGLAAAVGRRPHPEHRGARPSEAAGIRLDDRGFIEVDEYLETSVPGVYAMGDVKGGPAFTHLSYDDYRILHANLIRPPEAKHAGPDRPVHGVHRPAARPGGSDRARRRGRRDARSGWRSCRWARSSGPSRRARPAAS